MLDKAGYVDDYKSNPQITLKGLEYLSELMR